MPLNKMKKKSFVFCVDNSEIIGMTITKLLKTILPITINILVFKNYESLIKFIETKNINIKFIICEHFVSDMTGFEFIKWLIDNKYEIPIVIFTNLSDNEILEKYKTMPNVKAVINKSKTSIKNFKEKISTII